MKFVRNVFSDFCGIHYWPYICKILKGNWLRRFTFLGRGNVPLQRTDKQYLMQSIYQCLYNICHITSTIILVWSLSVKFKSPKFNLLFIRVIKSWVFQSNAGNWPSLVVFQWKPLQRAHQDAERIKLQWCVQYNLKTEIRISI